MREIRLFTPQPLSPDKVIDLDRNASRHASQVLRLKAGHEITLFNGDGNNYASRITQSGKITSVEVISQAENLTESPLSITLLQGISRSDKMDFTLQKSVELGVARIQPVFCKRSVLNIDEKRLQKKMAHWLAVIQSACEQSGRSFVPRLETPVRLGQLLEEKANPERDVILAPGGIRSLSGLQLPGKELRILVGPEGGFDPAEQDRATGSGFSPVSIGPRILRTETAGLAAIAIVQSLHGDLS